VAAADVEAEALKAVGIVVIKEIGEALRMLQKVVASNLANTVCRVGTYVARWYVISHSRYVFTNQKRFSITPTKTITDSEGRNVISSVSGLPVLGPIRARCYALMIVGTACSPCTALSFHVDTLRNPFLGK